MTRTVQEVQLDSKLTLIDSPGVVYACFLHQVAPVYRFLIIEFRCKIMENITFN